MPPGLVSRGAASVTGLLFGKFSCRICLKSGLNDLQGNSKCRPLECTECRFKVKKFFLGRQLKHRDCANGIETL